MNRACFDDGAQAPTRTLVLLADQTSPAALSTTLDGLRAVKDLPLAIECVCHGDFGLARDVATRGMAQAWRPEAARLRIWHVAAADRANAFNQVVHQIWPGAGAVVFTGGAVPLTPATAQALLAAVEPPTERAPAAPLLAATALPADARRRQRLLARGGLGGEGLALSAAALGAMRRRRVRLPLGHADVDALLAALLGFNLDPRHHDWDLAARVALCGEPAHQGGVAPRRTPRHWHPRQWLGGLEQQLVSGAVHAHFHLERRLPERLPRTSRELVDQWAARYPEACRALMQQQPLLRLAWARLRRPRDWSPAAIEARLLLDSTGGHREFPAPAHRAMPRHWPAQTA